MAERDCKTEASVPDAAAHAAIAYYFGSDVTVAMRHYCSHKN